MGGCEVFKEPGFIIKFVICICILVAAIVWMLVVSNYTVDLDVVNHLGIVCLCAVLYLFFPEFIMMIMYATAGFSDNLYEMIVGIIGAIFSLFGGAFLCGYCYEKSGAKTKDARVKYINRYKFTQDTGDWWDKIKKAFSLSSDDVDIDDCYTVVAVILFILCILFILDAVLNGAQKK